MPARYKYGRKIFIGVFIKDHEILPGQLWQASGGLEVTVESVSPLGVVSYSCIERGEKRTWEKDSFSFQTRFCLVLDD